MINFTDHLEVSMNFPYLQSKMIHLIVYSFCMIQFKMKIMKFYDFQTTKDLIAEWRDIVAIHESEKGIIVKRTKSDYATIYPYKQKVQLTMNVFNEKTVVMLTESDKTGDNDFRRARYPFNKHSKCQIP